MNIIFGINAEELFLFNQYLFDHSKPIQKAFTKNRSLIAFSPIPAAMLIGYANELPINHLLMLIAIVALTVSLPAYYVYPMFVRKNLRRRIVKMYGDGQNRGIIGEHELQIDADGLVEKTPLGEVRQGWDSIKKVVSHNNRTYIFISDTNAYILPKNATVQGDYDAFVAELQRIRNAQAN
jgi:hypothetical protein